LGRKRGEEDCKEKNRTEDILGRREEYWEEKEGKKRREGEKIRTEEYSI
jgi:hypothetical protein